MRKILEACPTCGGPLAITTVRCEACATEVRSAYAPCPFCRLTAEQISFVLLFLQNRGNLSEMEKALGVSYPTIRGKLDEILRVVAPSAPARPAAAESTPPTTPPARAEAGEVGMRQTDADRRRAILDAIAHGKLDAAGGLAALRTISNQPAASPGTKDTPDEGPAPAEQEGSR